MLVSSILPALSIGKEITVTEQKFDQILLKTPFDLHHISNKSPNRNVIEL
jgi:hypothetical protein